jgi:hypothetical protein
VSRLRAFRGLALGSGLGLGLWLLVAWVVRWLQSPLPLATDDEADPELVEELLVALKAVERQR